MKLKRVLLFVFAVGLCAASCKSQYAVLLESNDTDAKYAAAFDYFNKGKYSKSAALFETNFSKFVATYPYSPLEESAEFLRVDCLYKATLRYELDQTPTYTAMQAISTYLLNNPDSPNADICRHMLEDLGERLDRKAYENAKLYYRMEDYLAARVAFKNVLRDDADNVYREDILYYSAMSSYKYAEMSVRAKQKERYLVFMDDYLNFIGEYPDSPYRKELDKLYSKVKENN